MDPDEHVFYMRDGRRLTSMRVAGLALELAFSWVRSGLGVFGVGLPHVANVLVEDVAPNRPDARKCSRTFSVKDVHQQAILAALADILMRLHHAGYALVAALVPQRGHNAKHDLVLEHRVVGQVCRGQHTCEIKMRTYPSNRELMRSDCAGLFQAACHEGCRDSDRWLGQLVVVAELASDGTFMQTRAELLVRGRSRNVPMNVWGYEGRPCVAPPRVAPKAAPRPPAAAAKAAARRPVAMRAPALPKIPWATVWAQLTKYNAAWTTERVALLKGFISMTFKVFKNLGFRKHSKSIQNIQKTLKAFTTIAF